MHRPVFCNLLKFKSPTVKLALTLALIPLLASPAVLADTEYFETQAIASIEDEDADQACAKAFSQAEQEAIVQMDSFFVSDEKPLPYRISLIEQQEDRTDSDTGLKICTVEGSWSGTKINAISQLIGQEHAIEGEFTSNCLDDHNGDICWQRIVRQAEKELLISLNNSHSDDLSIQLIYIDFEGRQRDTFTKGRLEMTADGRFYFEVVDANSPELQPSAQMSISRSYSNDRPTEGDSTQDTALLTENDAKESAKNKDTSKVDVTLFYVWDGNDMANTDELGISSERFGVGLWANNRLGFSVFSGTDVLGIANDSDTVKNDTGSYETLGVGVGFRLWANRGVTVESMLYLVDAQPYRSLVNPANCDGCTGRDFSSKNYAQSTVNIKTNSHGVNVGWMFSWKHLDSTPSFDKLSSGFYLEIQI